MIRVLVADELSASRELIVRTLQQAGDIRVVASTADPYVACDYMTSLEPDVVVLASGLLPGDGLSLLRHLTQHYPTRVVWCGASLTAKAAIDALAHGASIVVSRLQPNDGRLRVAQELLAAVRGAAATPPLRRNVEARFATRGVASGDGAPAVCQVIAVGASTGGTGAIEELVQHIAPCSPPVLVVQHLPEYMVDVFVRRLRERTASPVLLARDASPLAEGTITVAAGRAHLTTERVGDELRVRLIDGTRVNGQRPSIDVLFSSLSCTAGIDASGLLLTGSGCDGAAGLLAMRVAGARTWVQDEATALAWAMPKAAVEMGAAQEVLSLARLGERLAQLSTRHRPTVMVGAKRDGASPGRAFAHCAPEREPRAELGSVAERP